MDTIQSQTDQRIHLASQKHLLLSSVSLSTCSFASLEGKEAAGREGIWHCCPNLLRLPSHKRILEVKEIVLRTFRGKLCRLC